MRDASVVIIEPRSGWKMLNLKELWQYRELLYFLTWRDVKVRYKQSLLGLAWAVIQPVMYMVVFTIVFGGMASVPSDGIPYPLFSYAALLPWTFFSSAIGQAGNSLVSSGSLITKVYFPRLAVPLASVGAAVFDFFVSLLVLFVMLLYYIWFPRAGFASINLSPSLLLILPLLVILALAALGVGTLLAALNVAYRDFKHTIPFLIQLWMFATPAIYMGSYQADAGSLPQSEIQSDGGRTESPQGSSEAKMPASSTSGREGRLQKLMNLNPMTGLILAFRAAVLGRAIDWPALAYSVVVVVIAFAFGCAYFSRVEDTFADII